MEYQPNWFNIAVRNSRQEILFLGFLLTKVAFLKGRFIKKPGVILNPADFVYKISSKDKKKNLPVNQAYLITREKVVFNIFMSRKVTN